MDNMKSKKNVDIQNIKKKIPKDEVIYDLSELFKVFGDSTRTKILSILSITDLNVSELSEVLNMKMSAISHQLRILRSFKLVKGIKVGKEVKYQLDDNHVIMIMECGLSHINEGNK